MISVSMMQTCYLDMRSVDCVRRETWKISETNFGKPIDKKPQMGYNVQRVCRWGKARSATNLRRMRGEGKKKWQKSEWRKASPWTAPFVASSVSAHGRTSWPIFASVSTTRSPALSARRSLKQHARESTSNCIQRTILRGGFLICVKFARNFSLLFLFLVLRCLTNEYLCCIIVE